MRTCTTEASLGKFHHDLGKSELIQTTTKKIVELIKVLIEQANANDFPGITRTTGRIYEETHEMATALILKVGKTPSVTLLKKVVKPLNENITKTFFKIKYLFRMKSVHQKCDIVWNTCCSKFCE